MNNEINDLKIPRHVAIILDGNGRWAKKKRMPRNYGHSIGAKTVEQICKDAHDLGVKYLTVFAFSTENWNRPKEEVSALMKLLSNYLKDCTHRANNNDMVVKVIGDKSGLSDEINNRIVDLEDCTRNNTGLHFIIAINYGGRDEIVRALKELIVDYEKHRISFDEIDAGLISSYLDTKGIPEPDLLIRTSGEERISNFMLWQLAYSEFYFTDVLWPDFNKEELIKAIVKYNKRDRRFGKLKEDEDAIR